MKISLLIFFVTILYLSDNKTATKTFYKSDLETQQKSIFLTKFDFGTNGGNIRLKSIRKQDNLEQQLHLIIDIVVDEQIDKYKRQDCNGRKEHVLRSEQMTFQAKISTDVRNIRIPQQSQQHIHYLYFVVCESFPSHMIQNQKQSIYFEITLYNDQSHFGEDEKLLPGYILMVCLWIVLVVKFALPIVKSIMSSKDQTKITVFSGLIVLGFSYFYRLLHLGLYCINGTGIYFFQLIYILLKSSCQFIIVTAIVAVGWGWSITHLSHDQSYILAGVSAALINTVGLIVNVSAEEMVDSHHKYDSTAGNILLVLRIFILLLFIVGVLRTFNKQTASIRKFVKKLGVVGALYLSVWPLVVLFSEFCLPNYMHNEVITFVQQITHLVGIWLLCQMLAHPESIYRKISIKEQDNPLKMQNYKRK